MENIWAFLLQTVAVSIVAALILLLKWLFQDKLSPRWQYGVWIILLLRVVLPVPMDKALFGNLPVWIETIKGIVEMKLQSAYTDVFTPLTMHRVIPTIHTVPQSITDWLFVLYVAGIVIMLLWYLVSYVRLRLLLRQGLPASDEQRQVIADVCSKYDLTACQIVAVPGLQSAFICGVVHPVLALPADTMVDEKIILHELLHLRHKDALRNVGWCVLRALHWCNPFLQMVFHRIGNDMESLCDQRVLERLEGEERRAYGNILLNMANQQYARAPGTSSISNGGKNISRRIAAIVRFKKYPKGMALVSVCIVMVLAVPALAGTEMTYSQRQYEPKRLSELDAAMAMARLNRCTTIAGALDTYAKGLLLENGVYIATASPIQEHAALYEQMRKANVEEGWEVNHIDSGWELEHSTMYYGYRIYNLEKINNVQYRATLALAINPYEKGVVTNLGDYYRGTVFVPVLVHHSPHGWVVQETGERLIQKNVRLDDLDPEQEPTLRMLSAQGKTGTVEVKVITTATVDNDANIRLSWMQFDSSMKIDADMRYVKSMTYLTYDSNNKQINNAPELSVAMQLLEIEEKDDLAQYALKEAITGDGYYVRDATGTRSGSPIAYGESNGNTQIESRNIYKGDWDGTLRSGGGAGYYDISEPVALPEAYLVGIYWDGKLVETFLLEAEVQP